MWDASTGSCAESAALGGSKAKICSRHRENGGVTCFTMPELRRLSKLYNDAAAGAGEDGAGKVRGRTKAQLYNSLLEKMSCGGDRCLYKQRWVPSEMRGRLEEALIPLAPREWLSNPTAWLSNYDIEAKVKELSRGKRYKFLGVQPMDFEHRQGLSKGDACVSADMCGFTAEAALKAKHNKFMVVFNTDYHDKPGSHWVALMGFLRRGDPRYGMYYYDSNGDQPPRDVDRFISRISEELKAMNGSEPPYEYNDTRHQSSNTECGMFCMSFLDAMMNSSRSFAETCARMRGDAAMIQRRKEWFDHGPEV